MNRKAERYVHKWEANTNMNHREMCYEVYGPVADFCKHKFLDKLSKHVCMHMCAHAHTHNTTQGRTCLMLLVSGI
jgi:hypothetical protein